MPSTLHAHARVAYLLPKCAIVTTRPSPDLFIITVFAYHSTKRGEQSTVEQQALISNAHRPRITIRGFVQSGFK
jgi:hypothetical protein